MACTSGVIARPKIALAQANTVNKLKLRLEGQALNCAKEISPNNICNRSRESVLSAQRPRKR